MAHLFFFAEARKTWMNIFTGDLTKRRYPYKTVGGYQAYIQPNVREIKFFDVSIPEQCLPKLMEDLSPITKNPSNLKGIGWLFAGFLKRFFKLNPINKTYTPSNQVRKKWLNIVIVGWAKDKYEPWTKIPSLPEGGELI